jgi:hypothetical protein
MMTPMLTIADTIGDAFDRMAVHRATLVTVVDRNHTYELTEAELRGHVARNGRQAMYETLGELLRGEQRAA